MNRWGYAIVGGVAALAIVFLFGACTGRGWNWGMHGGRWGLAAGMVGGTGWGQHVFRSNGERIYFTATSERGTAIEIDGAPPGGGWMMMHGRLACVSCHGTDGRGGRRSIGGGATMDAKDIRWHALAGEFDDTTVRAAITQGQEPDGSTLSPLMPRWRIGDDDLADLIAYLKTLP